MDGTNKLKTAILNTRGWYEEGYWDKWLLYHINLALEKDQTGPKRPVFLLEKTKDRSLQKGKDHYSSSPGLNDVQTNRASGNTLRSMNGVTGANQRVCVWERTNTVMGILLFAHPNARLSLVGVASNTPHEKLEEHHLSMNPSSTGWKYFE